MERISIGKPNRIFQSCKRKGNWPSSFSTKDEVSHAVESAVEAFESWRELPMTERTKYLFKLKEVLEGNAEELAVLNTQNHGKTLEENRGDLKRTIENVDVAISVAYALAKGTTQDQISVGIDATMVKEPLSVFSIVCPFNFPLMIPFWFLSYAIVLGTRLWSSLAK
jgi:malonate-semialdehyde dehydrogenase (acetylating)/methylmalonate-semialdehyde dehydrogenase